MYLPINAATSVEFVGDYHLHAWLQPQFTSSNESAEQHKLIVRAGQFSSFILLLGNISGKDQFLPKDAILVQSKDEIIIPLLLNNFPTPTEFKDAIQSLSPEQQQLSKAFRSMQLESSIFGVCVIPIKPQLEFVLGPNSLTKEIKLTQELMELFCEYQIPCDVLSNEDFHAST